MVHLNQFKKNRGFSLVEIMIVVAMLGGISLVVMNLSKQSTKSSAKFQFDTEINLITSEINAILSNPDICKTTFQANNLSPTNINGKYYTIASGSAPANGYGNAGIKIVSYSLAHSTLPGATATDGILTILFQTKGIVGGSNTPRKINIYYEGLVTAITTCRSLSTSTTDIWAHGAGTAINYMGGNVGIGTTLPLQKLHVKNGGIMSDQDNTGGILGSLSVSGKNSISSSPYLGQWTIYNMKDYGAGNSGLQIYEYYDSNNNGTFCEAGEVCAPRMAISPGGNVGIGTTNPSSKLEVAGGVKMADDANPCSATNEGTQRYNSALKIMEFCNGTSWGAIGGGGGFGGSYLTSTFGGGACWGVNSRTGSCSCPAGTVAHLAGQAYQWSQWDTTIIICY